MTQTLYKECAEIVHDLVGNEYLYFDTAIQVKAGPHTPPFGAWAVCVSPSGELYLMDGEEQWHALSLQDASAPMVVGSLYQRLRLMRSRFAKAS